MRNTPFIRQSIAAWVGALKPPQFLLPVLLCIPAFAARGADIKAADYVFKNGAVYTMDAGAPKAQSVAVTGKEISYVGDDKGAEAYVGENTQVIDLNGKMLLPGFVESHIHSTVAFITQGADLQFDTLEEVLASVKAYADANPEAKVIRGFGWRYFLFPTTGPTKEVLDKIFPDLPVFLMAIDGHSAWVNSKALEVAGINAKTPDPVPGFSYFQRDPKTKEPTGWVVEGPAELEMFADLAPPTPEAVIAATTEQLPKFSAAGITAAFDAGIQLMPPELAFEAYQKLEKENKLPLRIVGSYYWNKPSVTDPVAIVQEWQKKYNSELVQARVLKINLDGGESQHTAVMLEPYHDRPGYNAEFLLDPKLFGDAILKAQANGIDTHSHSYGDGATKAYIAAVQAARQAHPESKSRHTASHALFLTDAEVEGLVKADITMQTSPQWYTPDPTIELMTKILGKDVVFSRYGRINSVLKAGGRVAFGTDWPAAGYVSSYKPLDAIQVAMTRKIMPQYGNKKFVDILPPENEAVTLDQALKASTLDAAYVLGLEDKIGSLKAGKLADLVVLDQNLYDVKPEAISGTKVDLTMMNGRITHREGI